MHSCQHSQICRDIHRFWSNVPAKVPKIRPDHRHCPPQLCRHYIASYVDSQHISWALCGGGLIEHPLGGACLFLTAYAVWVGRDGEIYLCVTFQPGLLAPVVPLGLLLIPIYDSWEEIFHSLYRCLIVNFLSCLKSFLIVSLSDSPGSKGPQEKVVLISTSILSLKTWDYLANNHVRTMCIKLKAEVHSPIQSIPKNMNRRII